MKMYTLVSYRLFVRVIYELIILIQMVFFLFFRSSKQLLENNDIPPISPEELYQKIRQREMETSVYGGYKVIIDKVKQKLK